MLARTHMAIGILAALIVVPFLALEQKLLFVGLAALGSLLPDVDHQGSLINRLFPVTKIAAHFFKHRGFFHSIFPPLILWGVTRASAYALIGQALVLGYVTHLFSDSFTKWGVNYLYPLSQFRIMGFIQVGSWVETTLFFVVLLLILFIIL